MNAISIVLIFVVGIASYLMGYARKEAVIARLRGLADAYEKRARENAGTLARITNERDTLKAEIDRAHTEDIALQSGEEPAEATGITAKPRPEEIEAARYAAKSAAGICPAPGRYCDFCPVASLCAGDDATDAARAWLASHNLPVEEPAK